MAVRPPDPAFTCDDGQRSQACRHFYWDLESRSAAMLGKGKYAVGVRAYAGHPTTQVLCVSYALGNGPIETWVPGQLLSSTILAAAADPFCSWVAHHAAFERAMLEGILVPLHGWPMVQT
jgi:DNA polymerase